MELYRTTVAFSKDWSTTRPGLSNILVFEGVRALVKQLRVPKASPWRTTPRPEETDSLPSDKGSGGEQLWQLRILRELQAWDRRPDREIADPSWARAGKPHGWHSAVLAVLVPMRRRVTST